MLEQINAAVKKGDNLVCFTRKQFEKDKGVVFNHPNYLTHYYYKFTDTACVGICLRGGK